MRRRVYNDEELIEQVQMLAKRLGRTPTGPEFDADPSIPASLSTPIYHFGSWNQFLEAAGLGLNQERLKFSEEDLIDQIQMLAKKLGRTPKMDEFNECLETASKTVAVTRFGSWNNFIKAAGLKENRCTIISDEEIIEQVQMMAKELGRTPTVIEFYEDPRTAKRGSVESHFGTWTNLVETAGLEQNRAGRKKGGGKK